MSCAHEAHDHDHGHDDHEHGHGHDHDHDHDGPDRGAEFSLYKHIDMERVRCLNESVDGAIQGVFKPWVDRLSSEKSVESDADAQLIVHVPFSGSVKLKAIGIRGGPTAMAPSSMKVWINREDVDFDTAESMTPLQEWEMVRDPPGGDVVEYPTKIAKFNSVRSITLFFPENFGGDDVTRIEYIGFKGEFEALKQDPVVTIYELNANPADHPKSKAEQWGGQTIQ